MDINNILKKLFGNKSTRDMKEIQPHVEKIKQVFESIDALDNDALRAKTQELRDQVQHSVDDLRAEISREKEKVETLPLEDRESVFNHIDKLEKEVLDRLETELDKVMYEAFAIMKSTARRFAQNSEVVVTATDFDRTLAATHDFVTI